MYSARLRPLESFFEAEQLKGNGRALGGHKLKFHSLYTHQSV